MSLVTSWSTNLSTVWRGYEAPLCSARDGIVSFIGVLTQDMSDVRGDRAAASQSNNLGRRCGFLTRGVIRISTSQRRSGKTAEVSNAPLWPNAQIVQDRAKCARGLFRFCTFRVNEGRSTSSGPDSTREQRAVGSEPCAPSLVLDHHLGMRCHRSDTLDAILGCAMSILDASCQMMLQLMQRISHAACISIWKNTLHASTDISTLTQHIRCVLGVTVFPRSVVDTDRRPDAMSRTDRTWVVLVLRSRLVPKRDNAHVFERVLLHRLHVDSSSVRWPGHSRSRTRGA